MLVNHKTLSSHTSCCTSDHMVNENFISQNNFGIFVSAELKMDVLRERECKDSMERQFADERKMRSK